ncbi:hypothetical protein AB4Y43_01380 [Paraburkholderia sp. BR10872]|uniref:hypothetical protein n=1 Tax=Paraburkholderia sp. BR10872 TaxID=3236989 RepID=UPI0034D36DE4
MPSITETSAAPSELAAGLAAGIDTISSGQTIQFVQYQQLVLPLDGYIFWVNTGAQISVAGSLHQSIEERQNEDETISINRIVFTSEQQVEEFNQVSPTTIFIGNFNGELFSFSRRDAFYQQAGLFHYTGDAVYPAMASQLINSASNIDPTKVIVSNSLPVWMTLTKYMPMYPSFALPSDIAPPYASVHIEPDDTEAIGAAPAFDSAMTHTQLTRDRVRITIYGLNNQQALDFQDYVFTYITNNDNIIGLMNAPIIRDEKRTQAELGVIAMKKRFDIEVSYYQTRVNTLARQFITNALAQFFIQPATFP